MTPIKNNNNTHFGTIYLINMDFIKYHTLYVVCVSKQYKIVVYAFESHVKKSTIVDPSSALPPRPSFSPKILMSFRLGDFRDFSLGFSKIFFSIEIS